MIPSLDKNNSMISKAIKQVQHYINIPQDVKKMVLVSQSSKQNKLKSLRPNHIKKTKRTVLFSLVILV